MADALHGRCLCGALRFTLTPPTRLAGHCHCLSCRRSHGAAFVTWTSVPLDRFHLDAAESLQWHRSSAWIEWGFCGACGSSLLYRAVAEGHPEAPRLDHMYVCAAAIDGPLDRVPTAHASYEERVVWMDLHDGLPKYRGKTGAMMADDER